jgi:non-ribosomal peptide synthetase component F
MLCVAVCAECMLCAAHPHTHTHTHTPPPPPTRLSPHTQPSPPTGNPKGVVHTHRGVAAEVSAMRQYLDHVNLHVGPQDSYLSYLTLAHIYDR